RRGVPVRGRSPMTRLHSCDGLCALALLTLAMATPSLAAETVPFKEGVQIPAQPPGATYEEATPPLFGDLGTTSWKITTSVPQAQAYFDQGLRLAYGFNHAEARRAFRQVQKLDEAAPMGYWGEAWVLGPNINAPMDAAANAPAFAAIRAAQAR